MIKGSNRIFYGESLKRQVVRDYETGCYTYSSLSEKYGILGSSTVSDWCKKYSTLAGEKKKTKRMRKKKPQVAQVVAEASAEFKGKPKRSAEQDRISDLEKALTLSRQREQLYLRIITVSSEDISEDLLKKTGFGLFRVVKTANSEGWISIRRACRVLGYSKQAYHKREKESEYRTAQQRQMIEEVLNSVKTVREDMPRLGTRKLYYLLSDEFEESGLKVGRDKLFSILRASNLLIHKKKRYVRTTDSSEWRRQHDNLVEDYVPEKPEELLVCDITYFETEQGNAYGHLATDAYSKKIMGYEVAYDMTKERTVAAFEMAMSNRIYKHRGIHCLVLVLVDR